LIQRGSSIGSKELVQPGALLLLLLLLLLDLVMTVVLLRVCHRSTWQRQLLLGALLLLLLVMMTVLVLHAGVCNGARKGAVRAGERALQVCRPLLLQLQHWHHVG
jgi:hypothetical protein